EVTFQVFHDILELGPPGRLQSLLKAVAVAIATQRRQKICECCALTEDRLSWLARRQRMDVFEESVDLLGRLLKEAAEPKSLDSPCAGGRFGSTIIRCFCNQTIHQLAEDLSGSDLPFEFHKLTTGLSSQQRTKVLRAYMTFRGDRAAMCVLRRGREGLLERGNPLGRPHILALVSRFVTRHHVLLADGSIDVGIESLHRCTDSVVLQQLPVLRESATSM
ncbi:unnamed protein product, partial [Symbiodinium pilosum]